MERDRPGASPRGDRGDVVAGCTLRHLSFVETGRSRPSREMVLHLAAQLDLPLRERTQLLLAAGYAPVYAESALDAPRMAAVCAAVRQVLAAHEPYPAVVVDRGWNLVEANAAVTLLTEGLAPRIVNLGEWRAHLLGRLRRQVAHTADPALAQLYDELRAYPCAQPEPTVELPGPGEIVVPLRLRHGEGELAFFTFFSTVATFGTPLDVTVAELAIESFFPSDPATASALRMNR